MSDLDSKRTDEVVSAQETEDSKDSDILAVREVAIEEMAIDGICGVY
jgi:mycofactocin precursor